MPAPAASQKTVGFRLREEDVGVTWVPLDQTEVGLRDDAAALASGAITPRLGCEEELLELASPGLRKLPCELHGQKPRMHLVGTQLTAAHTGSTANRAP